MQLSSKMGTALAPPRKGGGSPPARAEKARKAATVCPPTVHRWLMTLKLDMSVAAFSGFLLEAFSSGFQSQVVEITHLVAQT